MLKRLFFCVALVWASAACSEESKLTTTTVKAAAPVNPVVIIKTSEGDITLSLNATKAPVTVANFLTYVESGFYKGTIFHRVIPNFMIQGGGFLPDMTEKATNDPIINESRNRLHNTRGSIAMARTNDPDSATAQFFINQRSNLRLDWAPGRAGYTVFGEVVEGIDVVDFIATAPTGRSGGMSDVPVSSVVIHDIVVKKP